MMLQFTAKAEIALQGTEKEFITRRGHAQLADLNIINVSME
jgi:hypothetical protein